MATIEPRRHITGVVVSAGKMINTVKVRIPKQVWNRRLQKHYSEPKTLLVSDPTNSTREGDVVALEGGRRISRHVRHVVAGVIAPMGPPMHERTPIPSAVERFAAVEAKRAAKDIRQAARGRWPAIIRVREREARSATGEQDVQVVPEVSLERFVKVVRRRKAGVIGDKQLLLDFIRVAEYQELQGELPLESQVAALYEARAKQNKQAENLDKQIQSGKDARTGEDLPLFEKEQLSKRKLEIAQKAEQLGRSITHIRSYLKEVQPGDQARRRELRQNPVEWYDLTHALSLNIWEQNIAALDLFGKDVLVQAATLNIQDVLERAGLNPTQDAATPAVGAATLTTEDANASEPALNEASIRAVKIEEQSLARNELPEDARTLIDDQIPPVNVAEDTALHAQAIEFESSPSGEKECPPMGQEPSTGPPSERGRKNVKKAQAFIEKGIDNESQVGDEKRATFEEGIEVPPEVEQKPGGFWGMFKKK